MTQLLANSNDAPPPVPPAVQVVYWLVEGHKTQDIADAIKSKWPGQDANALLNAAQQHFCNVANSDTNAVVGFALEGYADLYRRLLAIGDFTGAIKALQELVKLKRDWSKEHNFDEGETCL